jgi:hypothetical protein
VDDVPHKGLLWRILAVRSESGYDSHESSNNNDGLELIRVVDHIPDEKTYFANHTCHDSNVKVIDRRLETASNWGICLWHLGRGARLLTL